MSFSFFTRSIEQMVEATVESCFPNQLPLERSNMRLPLVSMPMLLALKKSTPSSGFVTSARRKEWRKDFPRPKDKETVLRP